MVIVSVLLQTSIPLHVLEKKSSCQIGRTADKDDAEICHTESNQDVTLISSQVGRLGEDLEVEDVPDKIGMVKRLYELIETPKDEKEE